MTKGLIFPPDPELRRLAEEEGAADPIEYKGWLKFATALTFAQTLMDTRASSALTQRLQESETPLLLLHGTGDLTVGVAGSKVREGMHARAHARTRTHIHMHMHSCTCTLTRTCSHEHTRTCTCTHALNSLSRTQISPTFNASH